MRLTHIKLAGFKSFVDPTAIAVPGQLVAVIGPNGCGKSNVIDAVRWVLGESSARQLRGESMQDVIFNGASGRKPVSRAAVELVFDNSAGQLGGAWGQYGEIAIKRVLTRQGESSYYINNQQVRRRDITDLFLGTGVGARGYAVIEQGMISRIIEARPEELRAYLEEAAGVSRYKERRRETENRLADTRDNLTRIDDLQLELARQVEKLTEQAEVAASYQDLRGALTLKQNLLALARREEAARQEAAACAELARIASEEGALEAAHTHLESGLELLREQHYGASDAVHEAQQALFEANAALARLEEMQRHQTQSRERLTRELAAAQQERQQLSGHLQQLDSELDEWQPRCEEASLRLEEAQLAHEDGADTLPAAEAVFRHAEQQQAQLTAQIANLTRERDLARQQGEHLRRSMLQLEARSAALGSELQDLNLPDAAVLDAARQAVSAAEAALHSVRQRLAADESRQADLGAEREQLDLQLQTLNHDAAHAAAEVAALDAVLAREAAGEQLGDWLTQQQLHEAPALWAHLEVSAEWRVALEAVLGERLAARAAALPAGLPPAPLSLVDGGRCAAVAARGRAPLLAQLSAASPFDAALQDWLAGVYCAANLETALAQRGELAAGECWITPQGHRVSAVSVQFNAAQAGDGMMARKAARDAAAAQLAQLAPQIQAGQQRREQLLASYAMLGEAVRAQKAVLSRLEAELNQATVHHVRLDQAARQGASRLAAIHAEQAQLQQQREQHGDSLADAELQAEEHAMQLELQAEQQEDIRLARLNAETGLTLARNRARDSERLVHELRLAQRTAEHKVAELARRREELHQRDGQLAERQEILVLEADQLGEQDADEALQPALALREQRELALAACRDQLNALTEALRQGTQQQQDITAALPALRQAHSDWLLKQQEARLNLERFNEELHSADADEAALLPLLGAGVKTSALAAEIARLARAIEGLGAVNLAALQELEEAQKRGLYLAQQTDDLQQAMAMLEQAIARIDDETRAMLQSTYDAVNGKMSEIFPTLFGGGRAELVLTGDDLLNAGIQIIAQPPGKKNSTIHLLSGGEKALTAMSLVFSLFSLNPAPFCLLDEVDAPLDDANTGRFCELVKQMAQNTQFLYISHNRLTMEMAEQLVGVTMQEQGVSRIVAVDIVEALKMRDNA